MTRWKRRRRKKRKGDQDSIAGRVIGGAVDGGVEMRIETLAESTPVLLCWCP